MDPNRAKLMLVVGVLVAGVFALILVRRMISMLKFSAKIMIVFVIAAAAAIAWWNSQRQTGNDQLRSGTDWRLETAPDRTLLR